jgi:biopolymer transport protein ExbB
MSLNQLVRMPLLAALLSVATLGLGAPLPVFAQAASAPEAAAAPAAPPAPAPMAGDTAPAAMAGAAKEMQQIDNPYGLEALWRQGDLVAKSTLVIMLIMSMGSWYIIFTKLFEQRKVFRSADAASRTFWTAGSVKAGVGTLKDGDAFHFIASSALKAQEHHEGTLVDQIDLHTWVSMSVQRAVDNVNSRLQDGLAFLATVGSTAPFVGLFGTVWGIYHALTAIGISGQASIDKVAGPVGEALIMTAIGLAVAVPAVMGYNWLIRRNKSAMERVRTFGSDVHNVLLAGKR